MYASHVLPAARDYGALYHAFRWQIPARYNIGVDVCDRWAEIDPSRTAIFNLGAEGAVEQVSYGALREASNRLANALEARGQTRRRLWSRIRVVDRRAGRRRRRLPRDAVPCRLRLRAGRDHAG